MIWSVIGHITFCPLPLVFSAHPLYKPGVETDALHRGGKAKRAGVRDCMHCTAELLSLLVALCTLIDCQLWENPLWPQLPEVHTGANRQTVMVIFFS